MTLNSREGWMNEKKGDFAGKPPFWRVGLLDGKVAAGYLPEVGVLTPDSPLALWDGNRGAAR